MATEIRFYHLTTSRLEQVLPTLLQRTLERDLHAVVLAGSPERVDVLNQHLWTFDPASFLPHGSARDGNAALQPVWLTDTPENPNGARVLFLLDGMDCASPAAFDLICVLFDGHDPDATDRARAQWKQWKDAGSFHLTYWQQTAQGWEKKAEQLSQTPP